METPSSTRSSPPLSKQPSSFSKKTANENNDGSYNTNALIAGNDASSLSASSAADHRSDRRALVAGRRRWNPLSLACLVISTGSFVLVTVTTGRSGRLHNNNYNNNNSNDAAAAAAAALPLLLRRGNSNIPSPITMAASGMPRRNMQQQQQQEMALVADTNASESNNTTAIEEDFGCDIEYCRAMFVNETLCSAPVEEQSIIQAIPVVVQVLILIVLLSFSALFSGLTLGLMSLDITGLEIVMAGEDPNAAKYAETIYPLRKEGNLLLCTLLLGNVAVNSLMAIFSAELFGGIVGTISSTVLIVIFGEIIPQALCSRYALRIGSAAVPTVTAIKYLLYLFSWPLAKALDFALGRELATTYSNAEMIELLNVHVKENIIDQEEANAMQGALTYKNIQVRDAMTAMEQTFMLEVDEKLSFETIGNIFKTGYSRIPVFEISRNNIIGLLFVKDLIFLDPEDCVPVRSFIQIFGRNVHLVWPDDTLGDVLAELKKGKSHLAVVRDVNNEDESQDPFYEVSGIITLEDIVERIIGDSIVDETDAFVDSNQRIKKDRGETFEWARLRLLDTKIVDEMLSASEISAITAHLKTNHSECFQVLTDAQLTRLVSSTPVTTLKTATQELDKELPNELLYQKNVSSDTFTLILSGKVTIFVGSENFRSDISSWAVLGAKALEDENWAPDYSAFVSDGPCRCIQIRRDTFIEAADASVFERKLLESNTDQKKEQSRSSTSYWTTESLSVTSSIDGFEDARSMASSELNKVSERRKDVIARLFNNSKGNLCVYDDDEEDEEADANAEKAMNGSLNGTNSLNRHLDPGDKKPMK